MHQADLGSLDANGNTALHSAAGSGAAAAAEFLLGRGLSVADRNKDGHTPMVSRVFIDCTENKKEVQLAAVRLPMNRCRDTRETRVQPRCCLFVE